MTLLAVWVRLAQKAPSNQAMAGHAQCIPQRGLPVSHWPLCLPSPCNACSSGVSLALSKAKKWTSRNGRAVRSSQYFLLRKCSQPVPSGVRPGSGIIKTQPASPSSMIDTKRQDSLPRKMQRIQGTPPFRFSPLPRAQRHPHPHDGPKSFPRLSNSALVMPPNAQNAALPSDCMSALRCAAMPASPTWSWLGLNWLQLLCQSITGLGAWTA